MYTLSHQTLLVAHFLNFYNLLLDFILKIDKNYVQVYPICQDNKASNIYSTIFHWICTVCYLNFVHYICAYEVKLFICLLSPVTLQFSECPISFTFEESACPIIYHPYEYEHKEISPLPLFFQYERKVSAVWLEFCTNHEKMNQTQLLTSGSLDLKDMIRIFVETSLTNSFERIELLNEDKR